MMKEGWRTGEGGGAWAARLIGGDGCHRGPMVSGGVREEERKVRQRGGGVPTGGPRPLSAKARFKTQF
jgi:hypothetical protein